MRRERAGRRDRVSFRDQRGSVLLISMVLIFVMTLLGLAFFDLAALESRLALVTQVDVRALEVSQAGMERALWELWQDWVGLPATGANQDWSDTPCLDAPPPGGVSTPCVTTAFLHLNVKDLDTSNGVPGGGTYLISVKLLTQAEAANAPYYQTCTVNGTTCKDLILVRSTGTTGSTEGGAIAGFGASRSVQAVARATTNPGSLFVGGGGIVAGGTAGGSINGNVMVAGSIHIVSDSVAMDLGGGAGQRNSWAGLDSASLSRLNPLPKVCVYGTTCDITNPADANAVETLNATLRVAPRTQHASEAADVLLSGAGDKIGVSSATETYAADASRRGKGQVDGVYVDDRYQHRDPAYSPNLPSFSDNSKVYVDGGNVSRGYEGTPPALPLLTDPVKIAGVSYAHYACVAGSSCAGSGTDFFVPHAADLSSSADYLSTLGSAAGLTDSSAAFTIPVTFTNKSGATVNGQVCWQRTTGSNLPPANTLEFGSPACDTPTAPGNPLLLYFASATPSTTGFKIERQGGPTAMNYRGAAVFVSNGLVKIEETFQTSCTAAPCTGQKFAENNVLALMTSGNTEVGRDNSNIDRVMGIFVTEQTFDSRKQTNIVGSFMANNFNFTSQVPSFFQVPGDYATLPEEIKALGSTGTGAPTYAVSRVPRFWRECGAGATPIVPSTATGICGY